MLFCDFCDRGYHIYCVGLRNIPEGRWHCPACARCGSCGSSGDKQWVHEYRVNGNGQRVYAVTLCGVCVQFWRQGNYCSLCNRCYKNVEEAGTLVNCRDISKRAHQGIHLQICWFFKKLKILMDFLFLFVCLIDCFTKTKSKDFLCPTCTDKSRSRLLKK